MNKNIKVNIIELILYVLPNYFKFKYFFPFSFKFKNSNKRNLIFKHHKTISESMKKNQRMNFKINKKFKYN